MGVCCKKVENGGAFFCKKWTFPQRTVRYVQYQHFLFYILLIWGSGCVGTQRTSLSTVLMYSNASILGGQTELN